jgi:GAF domain-containing protein
MERWPQSAGVLAGLVARRLLASADVGEASKAAIHEVACELRAPLAFVLGAPDAQQPLRIVASEGLPEDVLDERAGLVFEASALLTDAARTRTVRYAKVAELPPSSIARYLGNTGIHGIALVPLVARDELMGVLAVASRASVAPSDAESSMLLDIGSVWALWLQQVRACDRERVAVWRYCVVRDAVHQVKAGLPLRALLRRLVEKACEITGARFGAVGVLDPKGTGLADFVYVGLTDADAARIGHPPVGKGLLGAVLRESRPIRVAHIDQDPRSCGFPAGHPTMTSFLGIPMRIDGTLYGNLYLTDKRGGSEFTVDDEEALEIFGLEAALVVAYAQTADIASRERRLLSTVVEQAPSGLLFLTPDGELAFANPAAEKLVGQPFTPDRVRERQAIDGLRGPDGQLIRPEEHPSWRALHREVVRDFDAEIHRSDRTVVPVRINAVPVYAEGDQLSGALVEFHDRTTAKELERLREEWAAVIAHDLRNPISSILLKMELLLQQRAGDHVNVPVKVLESIQ